MCEANRVNLNYTFTMISNSLISLPDYAEKMLNKNSISLSNSFIYLIVKSLGLTNLNYRYD
jgi:hypothetical protein